MLFQAVMKFLSRLVQIKILVIRGKVHCSPTEAGIAIRMQTCIFTVIVYYDILNSLSLPFYSSFGSIERYADWFFNRVRLSQCGSDWCLALHHVTAKSSS